MTDYRVIWEIDIDADSPQEAATEALRIQRAPYSTATVFKVIESFGIMGDKTTLIDLSD